MTRSEAISLIKSAQLMLINPTTNEPVSDLYMALYMAISALEQEPCDVSVGEKEPNEITEEVTLRFFKNSLKVRWHDFVIYNVEWLKKNWQMEMDIVCGVKPCDDVVSRDFMFKVLDDFCGHDRTATITLDTLADLVYELPSVTQKSGKWVKVTNGRGGHECDICHEYAPSYQSGDEYLTKYCPNCGAKMIEPQENEEISDKNMKMWEELFKAESEDKK